jgi:hypothetical protein
MTMKRNNRFRTRQAFPNYQNAGTCLHIGEAME